MNASMPPDPALFGDYTLLEAEMASFTNPYSNPDYRQAHPNKKEATVQLLASIIMNFVQGGYFRGYRTQILGSVTAAAGVALWLVGDLSFLSAMGLVLGGLSFLTVAIKVNALAKALGLEVKPGTGITIPQLPVVVEAEAVKVDPLS